MFWHFDELSEFTGSDHGGFNATSDRGHSRRFDRILPTSGLSLVNGHFGHVSKVPDRLTQRGNNRRNGRGKLPSTGPR